MIRAFPWSAWTNSASNWQVIEETRPPRPGEPGQPARFDSEYRRMGVRNLFVAVEPLRGYRSIQVTDHRTRRDWALFLRHLADEVYAEAERIVIVLDNLNTHGNTHGPASF